ncbi:hypothetical protein D9758_018753 [Tetrapyrgos nigripes]|uniref:Uncharacterized protein n=1 Tax=Tetrapyrgos nigripes TaxID=182062 RepID=A0A8H5EYM8_9AGAR|nr:hypothetical protein D9758_018753 [Tetrapyrgos nigripes]
MSGAKRRFVGTLYRDRNTFKCRTTRSSGSSVETEEDYRVCPFLRVTSFFFLLGFYTDFFTSSGLPLIPDKPGLWVCAGHNGHARTFTYATHGYSVVSAILSTTTPGLIKLMQGGIWDKARCFELTQDTLQKMKALEVVDD